MQAIISPRTLHELCRVALDTAEAADLDAGITLTLLSTLLSPGSLLSLRNLILGRCVNLALALPRVAPQVVAVSTTTAGQAVLDNLGTEHALDCALAAAHLFVACSDASMLTKQHRLAILAAAALREAREHCTASNAHGVQAVAATVRHLEAMHAAAPDAPSFAPHLSRTVCPLCPQCMPSASLGGHQRPCRALCTVNGRGVCLTAERAHVEPRGKRGISGAGHPAPHVFQCRHVSCVWPADAGVLAHTLRPQPRDGHSGRQRFLSICNTDLAHFPPMEEC